MSYNNNNLFRLLSVGCALCYGLCRSYTIIKCLATLLLATTYIKRNCLDNDDSSLIKIMVFILYALGDFFIEMDNDDYEEYNNHNNENYYLMYSINYFTVGKIISIIDKYNRDKYFVFSILNLYFLVICLNSLSILILYYTLIQIINLFFILKKLFICNNNNNNNNLIIDLYSALLFALSDITIAYNLFYECIDGYEYISYPLYYSSIFLKSFV